ncbi:MAG: HAMP domain-containing protein [Proteobacteria bacterium]|nr:HAMP domain-containing protein [Pseudomonadota bacterium]
MEVKWFHSISWKIFALMSGGILLTVSGIVLQNANTFEDFLNRQIEDSTVSRAREISKDLERQLDHWRSLGLLATQSLTSGTVAAKDNPFLSQILAFSPEIVSLQILEGLPPKNLAIRVTARVAKSKPAFSSQIADTTEQWLAALPENQLRQKLNSGVIKIKEGTKIFAMALRLKVVGKTDPYWTVIHVPLDRLKAAMPSDRFQSAWVVDDNRIKTIASNLDRESAAGISAQNLVDLNQSRVPYGFRLFHSARGNLMLGAFSEISGYGMSVYIAQDAEGAGIAIMRNIFRTILWAWIFFLAALLMSFILSDRLTSNLRSVTEATRRIASGNFSSPVHVKGNDEVSVLSASVNEMSDQIVALLENKVAAARQEKELETARLVQGTLFPKERFQTELWRIAAKSVPASECGGDWWGHIKIDDHRAYMFIADATGHGAAAALVTAIAFSTCKTLAITHLEKSSELLPPNEFLRVLNRTLFESGDGSNTMTFFAALVDLEHGSLTFANAGHNLPVVIPAFENDTRFNSHADSASMQRRFNNFKLQAGGSPLGLAGESTYECSQIELRPGDKLMLYTDGLFESTNQQGVPWREKSLRHSITTHASLDVDAFQDRIVADAFQHFSGKSIDDDITVVTLEISKKWTPVTQNKDELDGEQAA